MMQDKKLKQGGFMGLSRTIVVLGFVSLLTDLSSEMMVPLIPLFMTDVLRQPATIIGIIEGTAECVASILRIFSGWLSDRLGRPKALTVAGYGLSSIAKPLLALVYFWPTAFVLRVTERLGKGIRSAPRDVIIAESVEPEKRGKAFGFHRAMDTTGAVLGPLAAFFIIRHFLGYSAVLHRNAYTAVFYIAAIPAVLGVIVLWLLVPEKPKEARPIAPPKIQWSALSRQLKIFLLVVGIFSIGNSSDMFLILRANNLGVSIAHVLLIYVVFNAVSAAVAMPAGILSDKIGRKPMIIAGFLIFAVSYLGFAHARSSVDAWVLFAVYGVYGGLTSGVLKAFAVDLAPKDIRGTVIGAYYTVEGLTLLPASGIAGLLWKYINPSAPFYYGGAMALIATVVLLVAFPPHHREA
jgi:MFS family permease